MRGTIRKIGPGRWQADVADQRRGIPRTRRTFTTRAQATEWLRAVDADAHSRLLGGRGRQVFGQALTRYLEEESPHKRSGHTDASNARVLRYPYWDPRARAFRALEHLPLDDGPDGIVAGLAAWSADLRQVEARSYLHARHYQRRAGEWWWQPDPGTGAPQPRQRVTDPRLLAELAAARPRGPYSTGTLRAKQILARRVLVLAWKRWRTCQQDLSRLVDLAPQAPGREQHLRVEQLTALLIAAPTHLDDAILGAAWIGWRRGNLLALEWSHVVFPVRAGEEVLQPGYLWYDGEASKNQRSLVTPMPQHLEDLLLSRWAVRRGPLVFHRGDGQAFGDFRKSWSTAIRNANAHGAGIPARLRWHDLRHTWASLLLSSGATDAELQALGNWKDMAMVRRYGHLRNEHLMRALEAMIK